MEIKENPWLGLNTYTEQDRLYGRDKESEEVADIVLNNLLTVIYGRSGIGKSSLLRAGVFPRMRYEDFVPVYIRLEHNTQESYCSQIRRKIEEAACNSGIEVNMKAVSKEDNSLRNLLFLSEFIDKQTRIPKYLMLVFDQFEEIFTLTDAEHKDVIPNFFGELASVLNVSKSSEGSGSQFRIVLCLREDYLYYLEQNSSTIPSLKRNRYCLKALSRKEGTDVICLPRPGLVSEETAGVILDKIDTKKLGEIDPSILSLFLHELYEKGNGSITRQNIEAFGDNIIADFYMDGMDSISSQSAAFLESRLVTADGYRHNLSKADAVKVGKVTEAELEILKKRRIITVGKGENNQELIELSHDVLCPVALKSRNEREQREEKARLDAKAKAMRRKNLLIGLLLVVAVSIIGVFWFMNSEIRKQQNSMLTAQSRFVAEKARELWEQGSTVKAMALLSEVYPHDLQHPDRPVVVEVYDLLREISDSSRMKKVLSMPSPVSILAQSTSDCKRVVTVSLDGSAIIWDAESRDTLSVLRCHTGDIFGVNFSPDGKRVLTASWDDATIIIWDAESGDSLSVLRGNIFTSANFSPDGKRMVTASGDGTVILWDAESGEPLCVLCDYTGDDNYYPYFSPDRANFSPDGKRVVAASFDGTAIIWDAESGDRLSVLRGHTAWVSSAVFSPDGKRVVTASLDGTAIIWDAESGKSLCALDSYRFIGKGFNSANFSPDGKRMVTASGDGTTVIIWDAESGKSLCVLCGNQWDVASANFSSDGKWVVTTGYYGSVIVWDTESVDSLSVLRGHTGSVKSAVFSPDGKQILTASNDETARIWDAESGKSLCVLRGHTGRVNSAVFSPDGKQILTASNDETARIWNIPDQQELIDRTLSILNGYRLSPSERQQYYLE